MIFKNRCGINRVFIEIKKQSSCFFFLFLKKETKNIRCAKIPKNTNKKAKTFKLLLLVLLLCLLQVINIKTTFCYAGIKSSLTSVEQ